MRRHEVAHDKVESSQQHIRTDRMSRIVSKGKNAVLLGEQLTGVHIHSLTNVRKIVSFIHNYLNDKGEEDQYVKLFEEHVSQVSLTVDKCNRRGSIIVKFNVPSLKQQESPLKKGRAPPVGRFITFNDRDHAVVHENYHG